MNSIIYVDLVGLSEQDASIAILGGFSSRAKPSQAPAYPGTARITPNSVPFPGPPIDSHVIGSIIVPGAKDSVSTAPLQPHLIRLPGPSLSPTVRLTLMQKLNAIPAQQLNMLIFALNPPSGLIPPMPAPQSDRTSALLSWAEGEGGCGLSQVQEVLDAIIDVASWQGSPYPGLRPFRQDESQIFFGRARETDALIDRLRNSYRRFLAVVGASGTGRSSLVYAGVLPRLQENAVDGSATWQVISLQPGGQGDNPFLAVANELRRLLPPQTMLPNRLAKELEDDPAIVAGYVDQVLTGKPTSAQLMLFVDQLEELFTQAENYRQKFVDLLKETARQSRTRVLVTLREDSLRQFLPLLQSPADPLLTEIEPVFVLQPGLVALTDMIRRPAQVAGVTLDDGVADKILEDAGNDPGALPLAAFCLNQLYDKGAPERRITLRQYQEMGGLHEAIGRHAAETVERDDTLDILFLKLVTVDRDGNAVRRRATHAELDGDDAVRGLVGKLSGDPGRLLTVTEHTVELAHDALLDKWPMLKDWIEGNRADMRLWVELEHNANNWLRSSRDSSLLWKGGKLQEARQLLKRAPPYLPEKITIDDMKRFIKASIMARWKTRAYVSLISSTFIIGSLVVIAVIMVYITPSRLSRTAMPVGSFDDNHPFGLYDVLGNVWEWTQDCGPLTVSSAGATYSYNWCIARGGSWDNLEKWKVCPSYPLALAEGHRVPTVGFRLAREVDDEEVREKGRKDIRDCDECPQMVILEGGDFEVRAPLSEAESCVSEPIRTQVTIKPLAIGKYEVTVKEWNAFKDRGARAPEKRTNGHRPITSVSWKDAQEYVAWLTSHTKKQYRLPSGTEWEYAARGNTKTHRWWGDELDPGKANCAACGLTWKQLCDWLFFCDWLFSGARQAMSAIAAYDQWFIPKRANTDTGGEFIFSGETKLTTAVFKHLPKVTRAYF